MIEINGKQIDPQHYIDKWTNWALGATPAADEQVIANVQKLYEKAGLKKPEVKVFRDYDEFLMVDLASGVDSVRGSVWDSVKDSVRASVRASVWDSVSDSVGTSVGTSVRDSVWASVRDSVGTSVGTSVGSSVWASVGSSVGSSVGTSVWASVGSSVGAWYWADDMAFADVFVDAGIIPKEKAEELKEYKSLLETQRISVLTKEVAYILVAPVIRRDETGRLHSDQRPAVEWENETGQYYLDGVNLTKEEWKKILSKQMTFSEIMEIEISDKRTVALKYNPQAILDDGAELVHADDRDNELYCIQNQKINKELDFPKIWFLKMRCPTGRIFIEGVPPDEAEKKPNATDMQALLCGLTKSEYYSMKLES